MRVDTVATLGVIAHDAEEDDDRAAAGRRRPRAARSTGRAAELSATSRCGRRVPAAGHRGERLRGRRKHAAIRPLSTVRGVREPLGAFAECRRARGRRARDHGVGDDVVAHDVTPLGRPAARDGQAGADAAPTRQRPATRPADRPWIHPSELTAFVAATPASASPRGADRRCPRGASGRSLAAGVLARRLLAAVTEPHRRTERSATRPPVRSRSPRSPPERRDGRRPRAPTVSAVASGVVRSRNGEILTSDERARGQPIAVVVDADGGDGRRPRRPVVDPVTELALFAPVDDGDLRRPSSRNARRARVGAVRHRGRGSGTRRRGSTSASCRPSIARRRRHRHRRSPG